MIHIPRTSLVISLGENLTSTYFPLYSPRPMPFNHSSEIPEQSGISFFAYSQYRIITNSLHFD